MNTETKQELMKKIGSLRTAEYMSGFSNGVQLHENAIEQAEKANKLFDEILKLICS